MFVGFRATLENLRSMLRNIILLQWSLVKEESLSIASISRKFVKLLSNIKLEFVIISV